MRSPRGLRLLALFQVLLRISWWLMIVLLALGALVTVTAAALWQGDARGMGMDVPVLVTEGVPESVVVTSATAEVARLPLAAAMVCVGLGVVAMALWLPIIWQLRKIVGSVRAGRFQWDTARRLHTLGLLVAGLAVGRFIADTAASVIAAATLDQSAVEYRLSLTFLVYGLIAGAVLTVLAEVIETGATLQDEQDLTV